jgi:phosphoribosylglycinamide formyltransferase-1
MKPIKIAILGSTRGTNLVPIIDAISHGRLNAEIKIVISNKKDAGILEKAKTFHLPAFAIEAQRDESREAFDQRILDILISYEVELIVLIGYMRILSKTFISTYAGKIINVHPSLLPKYKGLMDLSVHQSVLDYEDVETGCSVHLVTEEVDSGEVLVQEKCQVYTSDDAQSLKARVQALEGLALIEAIGKLSEARRDDEPRENKS